MSSQLKRVASDSDSEYESESEEEGTNVSIKKQEPPIQQKQQGKAESGSGFETDSDSEPESRYNIVKRDVTSKVATKAPANDKRKRDVNGAKGVSAEEPSSKKRKGAKEDKPHSQPEKISSPVKVSSPAKKVEKAEPATRGTKAKAASAAKVENARPQAAGRKRRASPPPPTTSAKKQAPKVEVEKSSPMKPKKTITWSNAVEECLVYQLHKDHSSGVVIPSTKVDSYWEKLMKRVTLEEDVSEAQLCEKVRRMKMRYQILKERSKGEKAKPFKSPHEEKLFQLWAEIWGPGTKTSQPAAEEDDSGDDSVDTKTAPGQVIKTALVQVKQEESSTDEEDEEDAEDVEGAKRKTDGVNQVNADSKVTSELPVVSPFISKPRLAFTPLVPKGDKRNISRRIDEEEEDATDELHTEEIVPIDDGKKGDVVILAEEHLKQLRHETLTFFQEVRGSFLIGGLGSLSFAGNGFGFPGISEGLKTGSQSQAAVELQKKWREHKIQELALLSNRLELLQEQVRLQHDELKQQNQKLG